MGSNFCFHTKCNPIIPILHLQIQSLSDLKLGHLMVCLLSLSCALLSIATCLAVLWTLDTELSQADLYCFASSLVDGVGVYHLVLTLTLNSHHPRA